MEFTTPLLVGELQSRYKRFFADINWGDQKITAHVPNTGSLKGALAPPQKCLFSYEANPARKLQYTLQFIEGANQTWVGINTSLPNLALRELLIALSQKKVDLAHCSDLSPFQRWQNYAFVKPEFKINKETRLDFYLGSEPVKDFQSIQKSGLGVESPTHSKKSSHSKDSLFIEVKNVSLAEGGKALFPDAVTERGQKHLRELMELMDQGFSCEMIFMIQRIDVNGFAPADSIDPEYGKLLRQAFKKGLIITPLVMELKRNDLQSPENIVIHSEPLPLDF